MEKIYSEKWSYDDKVERIEEIHVACYDVVDFWNNSRYTLAYDAKYILSI